MTGKFGGHCSCKFLFSGFDIPAGKWYYNPSLILGGPFMQYILMALAAAGIVAADQIVKYLVVSGIALHSQVPVIEGLFHLTYVQNDGAAFSMLKGQQWLFALMFAVLTVAVIWEFWKKKMPFTAFDRWCIAAIWAGGLGNMIDRLRLGYVVDMIEVEFMQFPVFNVADCFITCGCFALLISLVFFNRKFWKDEKKNAPDR